jgi:hypothetical protein
MKRWIPLFLTLVIGTAYADNPWETGVPKDKRDQANALFAEGNTLFAQQAHQPALEKYRAAIALIRLDRILEAADDLDSALRFGQAPFSAELYQQALDYQKLVTGRVGTVEATCNQSGAQVLLDGKPWFSCPGEKKQRVLAGEHAIVGEKKGYMTVSRRIVVAGGATASEKLTLLPIDAVVKLEYPSPRWLPWTTAGAGAAIALGGLGFWFAGRNQMDQFEADFAMRCPTGCLADLSDQPGLARDRDSAELKGKIAVSMMVAGGAFTVGGVVWAIINRPKRVLPNMEVQPTNGGMAARVGWQF